MSFQILSLTLSITILALFLGLNLTVAQNLKPISYKDGEQKLNGLVTSNAGKKLPGVLILPAWKGIDNEAKNAATELQKQGYIAFVADIYGEGNIPADNAAAAKIAGSYKQNYKAYQQRISVALEELKKQENITVRFLDELYPSRNINIEIEKKYIIDKVTISTLKDFDLKKYPNIKNKRQVIRNQVDYEVGLHILNCALDKIEFKQNTLFN